VIRSVVNAAAGAAVNCLGNESPLAEVRVTSLKIDLVRPALHHGDRRALLLLAKRLKLDIL
jgi:hypothetical protein